MSTQDQLQKSLQETIATTVAFFDDDAARSLCSLIEPSMFDRPLDEIVDRCLKFRKKFRRPPGRQHLDDVFSDILDNPDHREYTLYKDLLRGLFRLSEGLSTEFALRKVSFFVRKQQYRRALSGLVSRFNEGEKSDDEEGFFEDLHHRETGLVRARQQDRDLGFALNESRALDFLYRDESDFCLIGIPELDRRDLHPAKREMLLLMAARNKGKSWFAVHCGKYGLLKGWNVVHYTLENSKEMTAQRYFQCLFSGAKRRGSYYASTWTLDEKGHPTALAERPLEPDFYVEDRDSTLEYLRRMVNEHGKLSNLRVREFPTGRFSFEQFERDLDELESVHKFRPDEVVIDSPYLMKLRRGEKEYQALDELGVQLRGSAVERNYALVVTHQGNRGAETADLVKSQHVAGSIGLINIADNVVTYSQTDAEERYGLARLYAQKVRNDAARYTVVVCQNYATGQFCLESRLFSPDMRDLLRDVRIKEEDELEEEVSAEASN